MRRRRTWVTLALATAIVTGVTAAVLMRDGDGDGDFIERRIAVADLPGHARGEVLAHGGGRCVEEHPSVYRCVLTQPKQAHEGPGGRHWCFDSDGPRTLSMHPARVSNGRSTCGGSR